MAFTATKNWKAGSSMVSTDFDTYVSANMDIANQQHLEFTVTTLVTGTGGPRWIAPYALTINGAHLGAGTASTTGSVVLDILKSTNSTAAAVTLFTSSSELPTLTSGKTETTSFTAPDVTAVASGDVLTVSAVSAGSTAVADVSLIISLSGA